MSGVLNECAGGEKKGSCGDVETLIYSNDLLSLYIVFVSSSARE